MIDKECRSLCRAINKMKGFRTIESCCGHGKNPYHIWFKVARMSYLPNLLYWFDGCHCGHYDWEVIATTDCGKQPVTFLIEGPVGKKAYEESEHIAKLLISNEVKEPTNGKVEFEI